MKAMTSPLTLSSRSLKRMVRPRPQNLAATVFVFERTKRPHTTHVVYLDQASNYTDHPGWKHTATLDPAAWIEWLMNHPQERDKQIESLMARPNAAGERQPPAHNQGESNAK